MAFGGGFGTNAFGASTSAFGNPTQPLFGQSSTPFGQSASSFGAFGQSSTPFGQSAPAFGQSASAFGQSTSAFGQSAPVFGQSTSSLGVFGASQPSLWGQSSSAFASSQPFGSSQPFDASQGAFGAQSQSLFASSQPAFGQSQPFGGQPQLGTGWGATQNQQSQQPPNTRSVPYQVSHLYDNNSSEASKFHAITAMSQYQNYALEELRVGDYARGDRGDASGGNTGFGAAFGNTGNTGIGAQSGGGFGSSAFGAQSQSGFGAQSQPAFGAQPQSLFGAQSQPNLFGSSSAGAFGVSSGGLFGSTPNQAQSGGLFGGGGGGAALGDTGFGSSGFGQSSAAASGFGGFGTTAQSQPLFGGGTQQSTGGLFGGQPQSQGGLFGSQPQSGGGLFGSQPQSGGGLFGAQQQSSGGLFGGQQSGGGLFGSQPQTGGGLFGALSSAFGGSTGFGAPFAGQQAAQSAPSLFIGSSGAGFGGGGAGSTGLFGGQTSGSLFGNTGGSLFGSGASFGGFGSSGAGLFGAGSGSSLFGSQPALGASSSSLFGSAYRGGTGFGLNTAGTFQQQQQQQQGPLEASVTRDPYGQSQLFSSVANRLSLPASIPPTSAGRGAISGSQSQGKDVRVVVEAKVEPSRRLRGTQAIARQSALFRTSGDDWYSTSPVRRWGPQRSLFDRKTQSAKAELNGKARTSLVGWRSEEQKKKAANIRKLVIQPMEGDPILKAASGQGSGLLRGRGHMSGPTGERIGAGRDSEREEVDIQEELPDRESGRTLSLSALPDGSRQYDRIAEGDEVGADAETSIESDPVEEGEGENTSEHEIEPQEHSESKEPSHNYAEVENFNSRYIPYKDYYKTQMRRSRRQSGGSESDDRHYHPLAPVSSTPSLETSPSLATLEKMSAEELSNVESFKIWKADVGEIEWQEPVDLRGINLDETVRIEPKEVCVYPREDDVPAKGEGLNRPAIVRLHGIWKRDKETGHPRVDASTVASIVKKLKAHCEEEGVEFIGYEVRTGTWTFRAESF